MLHLTWAAQRFGEAVVERWQINVTKLEVVMAVNRGWDDLGYLERYRLVNHLGTTLARDDYRLRIIDPQGITRATYACATGAALNPLPLRGFESTSSGTNCELVLQESSSITVPLKASLKSDRRD
ncbi:MAG: hypothetical protein HC926_03375 [Synechococcaceae cyanobacterium SM2_3_60]|nr:hypothetical protein [Synechococcaceae cyanobacterium SM2_3_60]